MPSVLPSPPGSRGKAVGTLWGAGAPGVVGFVPNALSLTRLALGIGFPFLPTPWRVWVVLAAAVTDLLDGASGRLFRACSTTGRVLDPVADKVFVAAVVVTLLGEGVLAWWELALVGLRDLAVFVGAAGGFLLRDWDAFRRMSPTPLGKAATAAQFVFLLVLLVAPANKGLPLLAAATVSGLAALHYLCLFAARARGRRRGVPERSALSRLM